MDSGGNNIKGESRRNRTEVVVTLRCKHNGGKRVINTRIEIASEGQKTKKNSTLKRLRFTSLPWKHRQCRAGVRGHKESKLLL